MIIINFFGGLGEGLGQKETEEAVLSLIIFPNASEALITNSTLKRVRWTRLETPEV